MRVIHVQHRCRCQLGQQKVHVSALFCLKIASLKIIRHCFLPCLRTSICCLGYVRINAIKKCLSKRCNYCRGCRSHLLGSALENQEESVSNLLVVKCTCRIQCLTPACSAKKSCRHSTCPSRIMQLFSWNRATFAYFATSRQCAGEIPRF